MAIFPNNSDPSLDFTSSSEDQPKELVPRQSEVADALDRQFNARSLTDEQKSHIQMEGASFTRPASQIHEGQSASEITSVQRLNQKGHRNNERSDRKPRPTFHRHNHTAEAALRKQNNDGDTILHLAIIQELVSLVFSFLNKTVNSACFSIKNSLQQTPLHLAVLSNQPLLVRKLVVRGAMLDARDRRGNSPLHLACILGSLDMVRSLTKPVTSAELKEFDLGKNLQSKPADANLLNYNGDSPLHLAAAHGHVTILRYLLLGQGNAADVNVADGRSGRTILHHAVESKNTLVLLFLVQNRDILNLDMSALTYSGHSALALAESRRHHDFVNLLRIVGAKSLSEDLLENSSDESDTDFEMEEV